jgi:hypothetical protein
MPEYLTPGVYVEEIDSGPKPIESVGTAMPAFVGFTEKAEYLREIDGELVTEDLLNKPQLITNWTQFRERFGDFVAGTYLPHAIYGYFQNGGSRCFVVSVKTIDRAHAALLGADGKPYLVAQSKVAGYDGLRLRVKVDAPEPPASKGAKAKDAKDAKAKDDGGDSTSDDDDGDVDASAFTVTVERQGMNGGWQVKEVLPNVTLAEVETSAGGKTVQVVYQNNRAPEWINLIVPETRASLSKMQPRSQQQSLNLEQKQLAASTSNEFRGDVMDRSGLGGLEAIDEITMLAVPDLMTTPPGQKLDLDMVKAVQTAMIGHCEMMGDRVAILDAPPDMTPQEVHKWRMDTAGYDSSYATLYYPWIQVDDPATGRMVHIPPSGHVAGIWAETDNTRGVHKAPANAVVRGAVGLAYDTTHGEQQVLNPDGVNCIRRFPGGGIKVWGARTLSANPSWKYINVRRLFNMVEKSIERATQWAVFEPNDEFLWARMRRDISAYLSGVWSGGALFGATAGQAFFVKCDDELNPPESREIGRLIMEIGMAPVFPAEFIIIRISQMSPVG